ncbi:MAG: DNA gyrase inhibitor YacG [Pseudomonadota bacterium]
MSASPSVGSKCCPICDKPAVVATRPFCSKRCADIDLHRWLGGHYAIPVVEEDRSAAPQSADDETPPR